MENKSQILRPKIDNLYQRKVQAARTFPEGVLSGRITRHYFGFSNDAQLKVFLKTQKHLPFQLSPSGKVIPQFTKWEIIHQYEKEDREIKQKYISPETAEGKLL